MSWARRIGAGVAVLVSMSGCANGDHNAAPTAREVAKGLGVIEKCLVDRGYGTDDVAERIRTSTKFRGVVDDCGGESGVGADDVLAADRRISDLNNKLVRKDRDCMRRGGFDIATYTDSQGVLHLEDFDSKYVNSSNVDKLFDVYANCVDLPRSNFPSSNGFPTTIAP